VVNNIYETLVLNQVKTCDPCSNFHLNWLCCCNLAYLSLMNIIIISKEKERNRLEEFYHKRIILAPQGLESLNCVENTREKPKNALRWCFKRTIIVYQHFSTTIMHCLHLQSSAICCAFKVMQKENINFSATPYQYSII